MFATLVQTSPIPATPSHTHTHNHPHLRRQVADPQIPSRRSQYEPVRAVHVVERRHRSNRRVRGSVWVGDYGAAGGDEPEGCRAADEDAAVGDAAGGHCGGRRLAAIVRCWWVLRRVLLHLLQLLQRAACCLLLQFEQMVKSRRSGGCDGERLERVSGSIGKAQRCSAAALGARCCKPNPNQVALPGGLCCTNTHRLAQAILQAEEATIERGSIGCHRK